MRVSESVLGGITATQMTERLNKAVIKICLGSLMEVGREQHQRKFKHRGHAVRREFSKHCDLTYTIVRDDTYFSGIYGDRVTSFFILMVPITEPTCSVTV